MAFTLKWDETGKHFYETGVSNAVLYPYSTSAISVGSKSYNYGPGVAWNGITGITESPSGAEASPLYADNIKYLNLYSAEELGGTIEAYTYPDEFAVLDGSGEAISGVHIGQQERGSFGLCYRTTLGNDTLGNNLGYKLHFLYGCRVSPSEKAYQTINDSPEAITFSWELTTIPVGVTIDGKEKTTASMTVDSTKVSAEKMAALEALIYGDGTNEAVLPMPNDIIAVLS